MNRENMDRIKNQLKNMTKQQAEEKLREKYCEVISQLYAGGGYIWGTGRLGKFVYKQCKKNGIIVHGFIDNNKRNIDTSKKIYSPDILKKEDNVIIASFYCADIMEQLNGLGVKKYIYYEELAIADEKFDVFYQAFQGIFDELEANKEKYLKMYDLFADDLSKKVYSDIIQYRMSLDVRYTTNALKKSLEQGIQYFDNIITEQANSDIVFYDVGGYDGSNTDDFIKHMGEYQKIFFFEPDEEAMEVAKSRLKPYANIIYIQAGAGEKNCEVHYDAIGDGGGRVSEHGEEIIKLVALDDYINTPKSYLKLDIEGYEMSALEGMKKSIIQYKPMLAISVYHKCGDIHRLIETILSWNSGYKVYMRHYTCNYADTVCYFIDDAVCNR